MAFDLEQIRPFFEPRSIAMLGASNDLKKYGGSILRDIVSSGFKGPLYPVNRSEPEIQGMKAFASLKDVPGEIDLLLVTVPATAVPGGIADAVAVKTKAAVVFSAGFAEAGEDGARMQAQIAETLKGSGMRMVGPNCLGVRNMHFPANTARSTVPQVPGSISMITQSGSFGNAASAAFRDMGVGFANYASIGNMLDITHAELIHWCGADKNTTAICVFAEGIKNIDTLLDAIGEVSVIKPIIILKAGRSPFGQKASMSHTSSLAADGRVTENLLREAGATVVRSMQELFDTSAAFARANGNYPKSRKTAIFTVAGGPGVVGADHCYEEGLELPPLEDKLEKFRPELPQFAGLGNPVDVTGQTKRPMFAPVFKAVADEVDSVIAVALGLDIPEYGQAVVDTSKTKPIICCMVSPNNEKLFAANGVANYHSVDRAVRSMRHLVDRGTAELKVPAKGKALEARPLAAGVHREASSKAYLAAYSMPVTKEAEAKGADDAVAAANKIGYPVAIKVSSDDVAHKSDRGGVILNVKDEAGVRDAVREMDRRFPGDAVLIQEMVPAGVELIIGGSRNPVTGPVVMIGIGGVFTEVLDDVVFVRAPATKESVLAALGRMRSQKILNGYRGQQAVNRDAIADVAVKLSGILAGNPSITEVDLNPVIAHPDRAVLVDALIKVD